jgi:hypothetical protein
MNPTSSIRTAVYCLRIPRFYATSAAPSNTSQQARARRRDAGPRQRSKRSARRHARAGSSRQGLAVFALERTPRRPADHASSGADMEERHERPEKNSSPTGRTTIGILRDLILSPCEINKPVQATRGEGQTNICFLFHLFRAFPGEREQFNLSSISSMGNCLDSLLLTSTVAARLSLRKARNK